jgi:uncharacterized membrane protein
MEKRFGSWILAWLLILFSLIGLGSMVYVAVGPTNVCSIYTSIFNCNKVLTSPYSIYLGIKIYVYGIIFFSLQFVLAALYALKLKKRIKSAALYSILGLSALGSIAAVYLIYLEFFVVGAVCLFCTIGHVSIFMLLLISAVEFANYRKRRH